MEFNRKNMTRLFFLAACVILFYLSFKHMDIVFSFIGWLIGVLTPFIIAGVVIILMNVPLKMIERFLFRPHNGKPVSPIKEKLRRPIAIVLSISIYIAVIAVFLIIIIPEISKSLMAIAEKIPAAVDSLQKWLSELSEQDDFFGSIAQQIKANIEWDKLNSTLVNFLQDNSTTLVSSAWTIITSIISVALNLFLGIVLAIYVLAKKEKIASDLKRFIYSTLSTKKADFIVEVGQLTNQSFYNSITGQMMDGSRRSGCRYYLMDTHVRNIHRFGYCFTASSCHSRSHAGYMVHCLYGGAPADRGQPDIPSCRWFKNRSAADNYDLCNRSFQRILRNNRTSCLRTGNIRHLYSRKESRSLTAGEEEYTRRKVRSYLRLQ